MGKNYFKSIDHFKNYIMGVVKNSDFVSTSDILELKEYVKLFYGRKLQDKFTWAIKKDPSILKEEYLLDWISTNGGNIDYYFHFDNVIKKDFFTNEFKTLLTSLEYKPGVYSFWYNEKPLYIGTSINLQDRILSSFSERFGSTNKAVDLRYIITKSKSDSVLLEMYFICKLKPKLNGTGVYKDDLTLDLVEVPEFSKPIVCNKLNIYNVERVKKEERVKY